MSISNGSYTYGSGGDYASRTLAYAAVASVLTGDLTLTQISNTAETAGAPLTVDLAGYNFTDTSNNPNNGEPAIGWKSTINYNGPYLSYTFTNSGSSSIVNIYGLYFQKIAGDDGYGMLQKVDVANCEFNLHDCLFDGQSLTNTSAIFEYYSNRTLGAIVKYWNLKIWDMTGWGYTSYYIINNGVNLLENVLIKNCYYGIDPWNKADTFRDCTVVSATNPFIRINNANGYNNAGPDATNINSAWAAGSGNYTNVNFTNEFVSTNDTLLDFYRIAYASTVLKNGGIAPSITNNTKGARGNARPHYGNNFSIGPDEYNSRFHYLTIVLSNCTYNGNVFDNLVEYLESSIITEFIKIANLEFRGVGCSMVRGDTDSLTLGISAGYYSNLQDLTETEALALRTAANNAISSISGLTVAEVRTECTLIQKST